MNKKTRFLLRLSCSLLALSDGLFAFDACRAGEPPPSALSAGFHLNAAAGGLSVGNQAYAAGGLMKQDWLWSDGVYDAAREGGIWPNSPTYAWQVFNRTFTKYTVDGQVYNGAPIMESLFLANNDGAENAVVPILTDCVVQKPMGVCFGGNDIARTDGPVPAVLVGREIDVEFSSGASDAGGSAGLYVNVFNAPMIGPVMQFGGISGGTWANGVGSSHIRGAHYFVVGDDPTVSQSFINTTSARPFSQAAIVLGTGIHHAITWGGEGGGTSPYLYGDAAHNTILQLGDGGRFVIEAPSSGQVVSFDAAGDEVALGQVRVASVVASAFIRVTPTTVAGLAVADPRPQAGDHAMVTDAVACTFNVRVVGGGAATCPVVFETGWVAG